MAEKPIAKSSLADKELAKAEKQFQEFDDNIKQMTLDRMNQAPKLEEDTIHKIAQSDINEAKDVYLKPVKTISSRERFNENFRKDYEYSKEYVFFIAENREVIGETIELWTKPFAGMPAEFWQVPVGKPIWAPRYVAERIKGCSYHRMSTQDTVTNSSNMGQFYGSMVVDNVIQRLDALPATKKRSVFMGSHSF